MGSGVPPEADPGRECPVKSRKKLCQLGAGSYEQILCFVPLLVLVLVLKAFEPHLVSNTGTIKIARFGVK
ncbi:hypothetical protein D1AOALGA4SA_10449 [Olavius algarvensis Delta 1 endosymbiont]|nr:hypothetical protein D1AOALGA4SA_10449 [Olavius algarvensis Delta 1 endosymbiont]